MQLGDDQLERLSAALADLAGQDAVKLLSEARAQARAEVRTMLTEALRRALLEQIERELGSSGAPRASGTPGPPAKAPARPAGELGWYVYGVVAADVTELPPELRGVEAIHPVTAVQHGGLRAVTSQVPLAEFDEDELRDRLTDLDWVERTARAHEDVLDRLCDQTTVIPLRMCTVYRTEDGVREMLGREAATFSQALNELAGKLEWGVKVFGDPDRVAPPSTADAGAPPTVGPGASYLSHRRDERDQRASADRVLSEVAAEIHEQLSGVAAGALMNPPQRPEVTGQPGEMILNGVYLVEQRAAEQFHAEVHRLERQFASLGLELVETGPWPSYNFVPGQIGAAW
jgi:hypothetical protein